jgi:hypothetical protein
MCKVGHVIECRTLTVASITVAWHACQQSECRNKCGASHFGQPYHNANAAFDEHLAFRSQSRCIPPHAPAQLHFPLLSPANIRNLLPRLNVPTAKIRLPSHFRSRQSSICIDGSSYLPFVILSPFLTRWLVRFREIRSDISNKDKFDGLEHKDPHE